MMKTVYAIIRCRNDIDGTLATVRSHRAVSLHVVVGCVDTATIRRLWNLFSHPVKHLTIDVERLHSKSIGLSHLFPLRSWSGETMTILGEHVRTYPTKARTWCGH